MDQGRQVAQDPRVGVARRRLADVEDVAWPTAHTVEDVPGTGRDVVPAREQERGVQVPLDRLAGAEVSPGYVDGLA